MVTVTKEKVWYVQDAFKIMSYFRQAILQKHSPVCPSRSEICKFGSHHMLNEELINFPIITLQSISLSENYDPSMTFPAQVTYVVSATMFHIDDDGTHVPKRITVLS
jgi:hypothetical protein